MCPWAGLAIHLLDGTLGASWRFFPEQGLLPPCTTTTPSGVTFYGWGSFNLAITIDQGWIWTMESRVGEGEIAHQWERNTKHRGSLWERRDHEAEGCRAIQNQKMRTRSLNPTQKRRGRQKGVTQSEFQWDLSISSFLSQLYFKGQIGPWFGSYVPLWWYEVVIKTA